nr:regulatory protein RecX [Leucobacter ruminantium]
MSEGAEADWVEPDDGDFESVEASDSPFETRLEACRQDGVKLLARRARSSGELRDELGRLHETDIVEGVVAEFEQSLYLDDTGLARALTEKLRETKRASRSQIRLKLRERRLPDAVIEAAIGELDTDEEYELLREAASERARKLGGLDRQTAERRLLGFLARRGWSGEPAMRAVREAFDGAGSRGGAGGSGGGRRSNGPGGSGVRFR